MRRIDITKASMNIHNAFKESNISTYIFPQRHDEKLDVEKAIEAYNIYMEYYSKFGANEKKILKIFGLEGLEQPKLWAKILGRQKENTTEIYETVMPFLKGLRFIEDYMIDILQLLKQDHIEYLSNDSKQPISSYNNEHLKLLTVLLPETEKESSHPERLIKIIESINLFYKTFADLNEENNNDLSVVAIDSGSDKSFDFLGAAKVVTAVKELIIELWDRVVFFKGKKTIHKLEVISQTLSVVERINASVKSGKIGREQGEIFRRNISEGVKNFISSGAIIPEFEQHASLNPREIMLPEKKLLTFPDQIAFNEVHQVEEKEEVKKSNTENKSVDIPEGFSEEQVEYIKKLMGVGKEDIEEKENKKISASPKRPKRNSGKNNKDNTENTNT